MAVVAGGTALAEVRFFVQTFRGKGYSIEFANFLRILLLLLVDYDFANFGNRFHHICYNHANPNLLEFFSLFRLMSLPQLLLN